MTTLWLRLYTGILQDPKVQQLPPDIFKMWINLLCIVKQFGNANGTLPSASDVAFHLRIETKEVERCIALLTDKYGLLDRRKDGFQPHNWHGRQYVSDISTERVKRFRKRQRNVSPAVSETPPETETETETEKNIHTSKLEAEEWYLAYPRKKERPKAIIAYHKARKIASKETLLAGARREARMAKAKGDIQFTPYPATWLNNQRWTDEEDAKPRSAEDDLYATVS